MSCGGGDGPTETQNPIRLAFISIDGGSRALERGSVATLTATARDTAGKAVTVPFAWRSSADSIVSMGRDGRVTAGVPGLATVTASALGVTSTAIQIQVVWQGAARVAAVSFDPPLAVSPGGGPGDSVRIRVTNPNGAPVRGVRVAFTVTEGDGTVSPAAPALATTGPTGIATAKWTLGPVAGVNTITAAVVGPDSQPVSWVEGNPLELTLQSYDVLSTLRGGGQTGSILSSLSVTPLVKLVDTTGRPRAAVPITFAATGNGRVANGVVSTAVDGTASPGTWTLGDLTGDQQLIATVEGARLVLHATATGNSVHFAAQRAVTAELVTCAIASDNVVSCMGQGGATGTGVPDSNRVTPTQIAGGVRLTSLSGGGAHFCGTSADLSIYCWGLFAFIDPSGATTGAAAPTRLESNLAWLSVSAGQQHNCALANDRSAYCWGVGSSGQLGANDTTRRLVPQLVPGGFKFSSIASGGAHSCGILVDSTAVCWGNNSTGQIGDGTTIRRLTPTAVSGERHWQALGAGGAWTCGLSDNHAWCWGAGVHVPTDYPDAPAFSSLSVGTAHACAITNDGRAFCWGDNSAGQIGDSTTVSRNQPTEVVTPLRFASISAGFQHTCGVTTDGFLACWGRNAVGELGFDTPLIQLTPRFVVVGVEP